MIEHLEVKQHPAGRRSRGAAYEIGYENMTPQLLAILAVTTINK
jgi:hypothetical protein